MCVYGPVCSPRGCTVETQRNHSSALTKRASKNVKDAAVSEAKDHVGTAAIKRMIKIMSCHLIGAPHRCRAQFPVLRHNNVVSARLLFPAFAMVGIVWDSATPRRFAIAMLIIAIVCFSLAILFFLRRR
jgi:hypothetical protein